MKKVKEVVKENSLLMFTLLGVILLIIAFNLVIHKIVEVYQFLLILTVIYYILKVIYYGMFGVLND